MLNKYIICTVDSCKSLRKKCDDEKSLVNVARTENLLSKITVAAVRIIIPIFTNFFSEIPLRGKIITRLSHLSVNGITQLPAVLLRDSA